MYFYSDLDGSNDGDANGCAGGDKIEASTGLKKIAEKYNTILIGKHVSRVVATQIWDLFTSEETAKVLRHVPSIKVPCYTTMMRQASNTANMPVLMDICHQNNRDGRQEFTRDVPIFPVKKFSDKAEWRLLWTITKCKLEDIISIHERIHGCPLQSTVITLAADGVPICKSTSKSYEAVCMKFKDCRFIYPIRLAFPERNVKIDMGEIWNGLIEDINTMGFSVEFVIADAPKRAALRQVHQFNGTFGCDYCVTKSVSVRAVLPVGTTRSNARVYPWRECMDKDIRSSSQIDILTEGMTQYEKNPNVGMGIIGRSLFHDLINFDIITGIPPDHMHFLARGLMARSIEMGFRRTGVKKRITSNVQIGLGEIDQIFFETSFPIEFSRTAQTFDFAHLKGTYMPELY